jgi:hypothetical protein
MTQHLSAQEFVDAADGALIAARVRHIDECESCRDQLDALRQLMSEVDLAADVPDPSPLFWDHFSQRVRAATAAESPVSVVPWWQSWHALTLGALLSAAVMLIAVQVRQPAVELSVPLAQLSGIASSPVTAAGDVVAADDSSWDLMVMMASDLSTEDLHHLAAPMTGVADTTASDLTPAQQKELVRLIQHEMGGAE